MALPKAGRETQLALKIARAGFQNPADILKARTAAKVGLPLALAVLRHETGGANIFGHDYYGGEKAPGWGWGDVTKAKYQAFLHLRNTTGRTNGVGPMQLTSKGLQDAADKAGGCWMPQHNIAVGLHYLHDLIAEHGLERGVEGYNGSGPAAERYSAAVIALARHYAQQGLGTTVGILK